MNVMTADVIRELDTHVDTVLGDDSLKGAVITSAKNDMGGGVGRSAVRFRLGAPFAVS